MRRLLIALCSLVLVAGAALTAAPAAAAATPASVTLVGRGWGHGIGMGQYGAYGYALQGWSDSQILDHFYRGTAPGTVDPNQPIQVHLVELDGAGSVTVSVNGGPAQQLTPGSPAVGAVPALADVTVWGPWSTGPTRLFDGSVQLLASKQLVDVVPLDTYVAGVVPRESYASWPAAALEAQAVAARSYAVADLLAQPGGLAGGTICDTAACQVYGGTPSQYGETADAAVAATPGQVRVCDGTWAGCGAAGQVALTQYSASTGGYTAGGRFPPVPDSGDTTSPFHAWTRTLSAASIQGAYPSIGTFEAVVVTRRNGLGDLGGRVLSVVVAGSQGSVTTTGSGFAGRLGLMSDWFAAIDTPSGGDDGYWVAGSDGGVFTFGNAGFHGSLGGVHLNAPVLGVAPTRSGNGYWLVGADGGVFTFGDAGFYGSTGGIRLNQPVVGMAPTPDSGGYWLYARDGGIFTFGDAGFYGSTGGIRLNQPVVGMAPTADGHGYWLVAADGGVFTFGDAGFYGSTAAIHLNQPIVGLVPTSDGHGYWLVARDGGVFTFGDAGFVGSLPGIGVSDTIVAVAPTADNGGYLLLSARGSAYPFGDAPYFGDPASLVPGWPGGGVGIAFHAGG